MKGGEAALAALEKTIAEFNGDVSRIYLTGYSAGANGSWYLASHYPERFAAMVVICGFVSGFRGKVTGIMYPSIAPPSADDRFGYVAKRVATVPIWMFHGDADTEIAVDESRKMFKSLKSVGANVQYTEFRGIGHNAWDAAYDRRDLLEWLLQQRRER